MHVVLLDFVGFDRPERSEPHMQGNMSDVHAHLLNFLKQFFRKMKPRRRRRRRPLIFCVDRVVARFILQLVVDIGRQRHLTQGIQHLLEDALVGEPDKSVAFLQDIHDFPDEGRFFSRPVRAAEEDPAADAAFFTRLYQGFPGIRALTDEEQDLNLAETPLPYAVETRRNDLCIVDDQGVSRFKEGGDIPEASVRNLAGFPVQVHETRGGPVEKRILCDQLLRKIIIKITCFHFSAFKTAGLYAPPVSYFMLSV